MRYKGNEAGQEAGRLRARKLYPILGKCELCENKAVERHHNDGNTLKNERLNLRFLCRHDHMKVDGRLNKLIERNRQIPKLQLKKICMNCGALAFPLRKGLCHSCNEYNRRNGTNRPIREALDGSIQQICQECQQWFVRMSHHAKYCSNCKRTVYLRKHASYERQGRLSSRCHSGDHGIHEVRDD